MYYLSSSDTIREHKDVWHEYTQYIQREARKVVRNGWQGTGVDQTELRIKGYTQSSVGISKTLGRKSRGINWLQTSTLLTLSIGLGRESHGPSKGTSHKRLFSLTKDLSTATSTIVHLTESQSKTLLTVQKVFSTGNNKQTTTTTKPNVCSNGTDINLTDEKNFLIENGEKGKEKET